MSCHCAEIKQLLPSGLHSSRTCVCTPERWGRKKRKHCGKKCPVYKLLFASRSPEEPVEKENTFPQFCQVAGQISRLVPSNCASSCGLSTSREGHKEKGTQCLKGILTIILALTSRQKHCCAEQKR